MNIRRIAVPAVLFAAAVCAAPEACLGQSLPQAAASGPLEQAAYESRLPFHEADVSARLNNGSAVVLAPPVSGAAMRQLTAAGKLAGAADMAPVEPRTSISPPKPRSPEKPYGWIVENSDDNGWQRAGKSILSLVLGVPIYAWAMASDGFKEGGIGLGLAYGIFGLIFGIGVAIGGFIRGGIPKGAGL